MLRTEEVYTDDMVAQIWAQQKQDRGRNISGLLYFTDNTIYAYDGTFPIASIIDGKDTGKVLLLTTRRGDRTTLGYIKSVIHACKDNCGHLTRIDVLYPSIDEKMVDDNLSNYRGNINESFEKIKKSPSSIDIYLPSINKSVRNGNAFAELVGRSYRFESPNTYIKEIMANYVASKLRAYKEAQKVQRVYDV